MMDNRIGFDNDLNDMSHLYEGSTTFQGQYGSLTVGEITPIGGTRSALILRIDEGKEYLFARDMNPKRRRWVYAEAEDAQRVREHFSNEGSEVLSLDHSFKERVRRLDVIINDPASQDRVSEMVAEILASARSMNRSS